MSIACADACPVLRSLFLVWVLRAELPTDVIILSCYAVAHAVL